MVILLCSCDNSTPLSDGAVPGCTNPTAENYNPAATSDDGSCIIYGCMDAAADNYNPDATVDDGSCDFSSLSHFQLSINPTGENQLIVFLGSISSLSVGDEIGIFDESVRINYNDCSDTRGEILTGSGVWQGDQLELVAIGSVDTCPFGGVQLPGYIDDHPLKIVIWDKNVSVERNAIAEYALGTGRFGEIIISISQISFE